MIFRAQGLCSGRALLRWVTLLLSVSLAVSGLSSPLAACSAQADGVTPTNAWVDIYSTASTLDGQPVPVGAVIAVFDPQGVQCGEFTVTKSGWYGLMPCYGDDPHTAIDEGAVSGDVLSFAINGRAALTEAISKNGASVPPGTAVAWLGHGTLWQVDLHVAAVLPVSIAQTGAPVTLGWRHELPQIATYEVWRSSEPYIAPGTPGATRRATLAPDAGNEMTWSDPDTAGDPVTHYYYHVRGMDAAEQPVTTSQEVGRFTFNITPP